MGKGVSVSGLNEHLKCPLCEGYLIDATTITECRHSFCRSCILNYIEETADREGNSLCPECPKDQWNPVETTIRSEARHLVLQPDLKLQDLVYKLVPGLYKDGGKWERHLAELFIFTPDDLISFSLQSGFPANSLKYHRLKEEVVKEVESSPAKKKKRSPKGVSEEQREKEAKLRELKFKRYFQCPGAVQIGQLKKLLFYKLELPPKYKMEVFHSQPQPLKDSLTLMDLAYIYSWQRKSPMQLYFNIVKPELEDMVEPPPLLVAQLSPALPSPVTATSSSSTTPPPDPTITTATLPIPSSSLHITPLPLLHPTPVPVTAADGQPPPRKKRKPSQPKKSLETESAPPTQSSPLHIPERREEKMDCGPPSDLNLLPPNLAHMSHMPPGMMGFNYPMPPFPFSGPRGYFPHPHPHPHPHPLMNRYPFPQPPVSVPLSMSGIFPSNGSSPSPAQQSMMGRPGSTGGGPRQGTSSPFPPPPLLSRGVPCPPKRGLPPSCPPPPLTPAGGPGAVPLPPTSSPRAPLTGIPTVLYDGSPDSRGMQGLLVFPHRT